MSYMKNTWQSGDIITKANLDNMEDGINEADSSYTKNTWQSGDIITKTKLDHMEDGIYDANINSFGTLTVDMTNEAGIRFEVLYGSYEDGASTIETSTDTTGVYKIPYYKGGGDIYVSMDTSADLTGVSVTATDEVNCIFNDDGGGSFYVEVTGSHPSFTLTVTRGLG